MDELKQLSIERNYFLRREAIEIGIRDRRLHAGVKDGSLVRIRQGAYCHMSEWRAMSLEARFRARGRASYDLTPAPVALSHVSALAEYDAPLWSVPFDFTHLARLDDRHTRREAQVVHHVAGSRPPVLMNGRWVTDPVATMVHAMSMLKTEAAIVVGDWFVNQGLVDRKEAHEYFELIERWPNTLTLQLSMRFIDAAAQSVLESRLRYLFFRMGLPAPILQWTVLDGARVVAIVDFAWPEQNVYAEADGLIKYGRLLKPGETAGDVITAEKIREDDIRRVTLGTMVRFIWTETHRTSAPALQLEGLLRPKIKAA